MVAMGTLMPRKARAAGPRLVRVHTDAEAGVAVVELSDKERSNTISHDLAEDVALAADSIRNLDGIRAIMLHGAGQHFSVGVNPYNYISDSRAPLVASAYSCEKLLDGFVKLRGLRIPFVCAVHGKLIGAALAASLNADFIVAHADASFCHGNIVRGVCPLGMLSRTLVKSVGSSRALQMYLTNKTLTGADALSFGLVHELCSGSIEATHKRAASVARQLAQDSEQAAAILDARDPIDPERLAAEAVGHASCLDANGGRYANSVLPSADDPLPTGFAETLLDASLDTLAHGDEPPGVHEAEVPATLNQAVMADILKWPEAALLVIRGLPE